MPIPRQRTIVATVWCLTIARAVHAGVFLPQAPIGASMSATREFSAFSSVFGLFGPPLCVLLSAHFKPPAWMESFGGGWITRWVDRRWGDGAAHGFVRAVRPTTLVAVACLVGGSVGLASCVHAKAPPFAFELASFLLAGSVGFGIARVLAVRLMPDTPWV